MGFSKAKQINVSHETTKKCYMLNEITREQANEIILRHLKRPARQVVICAGGKWYNCEHATKKRNFRLFNMLDD